MEYMINVDLEAPNVSGGGTDCQSELHEGFGRHYDLTVHERGCRCRNSRSVNRPPTRYWDDNDGEGYSLEEVVERLRTLQAEHADAYPRRCRTCSVEVNPPLWD